MEKDIVTFERRRYGRTTYTWAYLHLGNKKIGLGDPWPGVMWPKRVLQEEIATAKAQRAVHNLEEESDGIRSCNDESPAYLQLLPHRSSSPD